MARPPKDEEIAQGVKYFEFGLSAMASYARPSVGVTDLTSSEAAAIFSYEIENWSELDGPALPTRQRRSVR